MTQEGPLARNKRPFAADGEHTERTGHSITNYDVFAL